MAVSGCSYLLCDGVLRFPKLVKLELNAIREANFDLITSFASRAIGPHLRELHCNMKKSDDATGQNKITDRLLLRSLWDRLQTELERTRESSVASGPSIYFQSVRLANSADDTVLFTGQDLYAIRSHFAGLNRLASPCLHVNDYQFDSAQLADVHLFQKIYPNINAVHVVRSPKSDWSNKGLLAFLQQLHSLVKLELYEARLPSEFYTELSNSLSSSNGRPIVSTLNAFIVIEKAGFGLNFSRDFRLLAAFAGLRYLHMNLQNKLQMLTILQVDCWPTFKFKFDFRCSGGSRAVLAAVRQTNFKRCTVRRSLVELKESENVKYRCRYDLNLDVHEGENHPSVCMAYETFDSLEDLEVFIYLHDGW